MAGETRSAFRPESCGDLRWWEAQGPERGVLVAFTQRTGGVSGPPYESLNLATHVGDDAAKVAANRALLMRALGLSACEEKLTFAEQVHGADVAVVSDDASGAPPGGVVSGVDGLVTRLPGVPLLLCFADCVPIVLVGPGPVVGVVHAGWRGALGWVASAGVSKIAEAGGCGPSDIHAYIGPHICPRHYEVSEEILSHFEGTFGTFARAATGGLDLGAAVTADLIDAGVLSCNIASLGRCTAEETDRFYSHRAEAGSTGRHAAVACILP